MDEDTRLRGLSLPDRLRVLAFDAGLTKTPEPLVAAIWEAIATVERSLPERPRRPKSRRVTPL